MPRNPSGVMILPAGNPVIPGTLIESSWANPTMTDLANEITQSLPRSGAAPMLGPLVLARDGVLPKEAATVDQLNGAIAGSNNYLPAGAIQYFAMVAIPTGWLEANGAAVSRTTYANLFATIGTVFGDGNGTTTFNLPDLRGTFIRGFDNGRSIDPGRVFGTSQDGSNAVHSHGVSDPGHSHGASQPAHNHGVNDPGHAHSINASTGIGGGTNLPQATYYGPDNSVGTYPAGTGISLQAAQPGVSVAASYSGVSVGASGGEARPVNLALVACIKAFGALQTDGLGTMAFQNRDAVNITGGAGVFGSLQCTKAPTAPNDVARFSDIGGVDSVLSSDIQVLAVDATDPLVPVLRPRTNVPWGMVKLNAAGQIPTSLMPVSDFNYQGPWSAAGGNTPSQAYPGTTFHDGDTYQISVSGNLTLYGADGLPSMVTCPVGSTITYVTGSPTFPSAGWYYNPPSFVSGVYAASVINILINGEVTRINQRGVANWGAVAIGAYGYDRWKKVDASNILQIVEAGNYKPNTVYTLSGDNVVTGQITSPASGHWTTPYIPIGATNVQLEEGSIATKFEHRSIGFELALCKDYCRVIPASTFIASGTLRSDGTAGYHTCTSAYGMRADPTVIYTGAVPVAFVGDSSNSITSMNIRNYGGGSFNCPAIGTNGQSVVIFLSSSMILSAEL